MLFEKSDTEEACCLVNVQNWAGWCGSNTKLVFGWCPFQILVGALAVPTEAGGHNLPLCRFIPCLQHSNIIESNLT
jgi:hypothetical protein